MKAKIKVLLPVVDYCAFMVSIALRRLNVDANSVGFHWCSQDLSAKLALLPFTESGNFFINWLALSHGLILFQVAIKALGFEIERSRHEHKFVPPYLSLEQSKLSIEVRCLSYTSPITDKDELLSTILNTRNALLKFANYESSSYRSAAEVFSVMYLPLSLSTLPILEEEVSTTKLNGSLNIRKSPSSMSKRSIQNYSKIIISSVEEKVGEDNSLFFLKSAVKVLNKKRKLKDDDAEEEEEEVDKDLMNEFLQDIRLQSVTNELSIKVMTFTREEKKIFLNLLDVVKTLLISKNCLKVDKTALKMTECILGRRAYYNHVKVRDLQRWNIRRNKKLEEREKGVEINDTPLLNINNEQENSEHAC